MQKITIIGRLGRDAQVRELPDGGKVISFVVAVNGRYRNVDKTSWYDVTSFNYARYKNMVQYFTKGSSVIVVGELDADIDEGKDGVMRCRRSITADSIEFNSNGTSGGTATEAASEAPKKKATKVEAVPADEPADEPVEETPKVSRKPKKAAPVEVEDEGVDEQDGGDSEDLPF